MVFKAGRIIVTELAIATLDVAIPILDCMQLLADTCMQVTVAINAAKLQLCVLKQNSRSTLLSLLIALT